MLLLMLRLLQLGEAEHHPRSTDCNNTIVTGHHTPPSFLGHLSVGNISIHLAADIPHSADSRKLLHLDTQTAHRTDNSDNFAGHLNQLNFYYNYPTSPREMFICLFVCLLGCLFAC